MLSMFLDIVYVLFNLCLKLCVQDFIQWHLVFWFFRVSYFKTWELCHSHGYIVYVLYFSFHETNPPKKSKKNKNKKRLILGCIGKVIWCQIPPYLSWTNLAIEITVIQLTLILLFNSQSDSKQAFPTMLKYSFKAALKCGWGVQPLW